MFSRHDFSDAIKIIKVSGGLKLFLIDKMLKLDEEKLIRFLIREKCNQSSLLLEL
jgi:hypothetical protein